MNNKKILTGIIGTALALTPFMAFAEDGANVDVNASAGVHAGPFKVNAQANADARAQNKGKLEDRAHERADMELDRRIDGLTNQKGRIDDMKRVSEADQASILASIQAQIDALVSLKAKIAADTSTTTLKADLESITKSYRIFALVMPKSAITAAADRIETVVGQMQTLSGKLETRINDASTTDKTVMVNARADMDVKVADADVQAKTAIALVANLQPDNGDAAVQASNKTALTNARAKIQAAQADLKAARADVSVIVKALGGKK